MKVRREFSSLAEFVEAAEGASEMDSELRSSRIEAAYKLKASLTGNFGEACTLAFGWKEGADRIESERLRLAPKANRTRKVAAMREVGPGVISMGNFLAGHPQPYVVLNDTDFPRKGRGKVVHLLVNIGASSNVTASVIERRGGAVLALVDALERAGRRVEIVAVHATTGGGTKARMLANMNNPDGPRLDYRIRLKRADEKLNLYTLAFALAHPSMQRRLSFSVKECESQAIRTEFQVGGNYGASCNVEPEAGVVYLAALFNNNNPAWNSDSAAAGWVREQCEAQGVKLF